MELLLQNKQGKSMQLEFWKKRPQVISQILSKVDWCPVVLRVDEFFLFITGESHEVKPVASLDEKESEERVLFVLHSNKPPFNEVNKITHPKAHFTAASTVHHNTLQQTRTFSFAVMH